MSKTAIDGTDAPDPRAEAAVLHDLLLRHDAAAGDRMWCCCDQCAVAIARLLHPALPPDLTPAQARRWPPLEWTVGQ